MQIYIDIVELVQLRRVVQPELYAWRVEILQRDLPKPMTEHTTLLLASVLWCGFTLFDTKMHHNPEVLTLADAYHPIGKREFDRGSIQGLQKSLNHCHRVNQLLIKELAEKDKQIAELRRDKKQLFWLLTKSITITAGVTSLATIGLEYLMRMK